MTKPREIGDNLFQYGSNVRLERGFATHPDKPCSWVVSRKVDVSDDPDTTEDHRWDDVATFDENADSPGEAPAKAIERAEAEAAKE